MLLSKTLGVRRRGVRRLETVMVAEWNLATDGLRVVLESLPRVTLLKHGGYLGTKIFSFFRSMLTVFSKPLPLFFRPQILIH